MALKITTTAGFASFAALLAALAPRPAMATDVTVNFTGTYDNSSIPGQGGGGGCSPNCPPSFDLTPFENTISGSWTYDSGATGSPNGAGGVGYAFLAMTFTVGGYSATDSGAGADDGIYVYNSSGSGDSYQVVANALSGANVGDYSPAQALVDFDAPYNTVFTSTALPTSLPDPSAFSYQHTIQLTFNYDYYEPMITYTITSLSTEQEASITPEPSTIVLAGGALAVLALARRRARRRSPVLA
jgi:hypothetical protein